MSEKRKPYASITVYKPRFSRVVATGILLILLAGVLGGMVLREIYSWQSALMEAERQLQERTELLEERTARLKAAEEQLEKAERRLRSAPLIWRTLEPAGFSVTPNINGRHGLMTATVCARGHMDYEAYVHFFSLDRLFIAELAFGGDYELVGKAPNEAAGRDRDQYIRYYTRKDVSELHPYTWESTRAHASAVHVEAWRDRLASYCSATYE